MSYNFESSGKSRNLVNIVKVIKRKTCRSSSNIMLEKLSSGNCKHFLSSYIVILFLWFHLTWKCRIQTVLFYCCDIVQWNKWLTKERLTKERMVVSNDDVDKKQKKTVINLRFVIGAFSFRSFASNYFARYPYCVILRWLLKENFKLHVNAEISVLRWSYFYSLILCNILYRV